MEIIVTQFLRPDGRKKLVKVNIPDECKDQYELLCSKGCNITAEELTTGQVAQYITHEGIGGDFAIKITAPGVLAIKALQQMIRDFDGRQFDNWMARKT